MYICGNAKDAVWAGCRFSHRAWDHKIHLEMCIVDTQNIYRRYNYKNNNCYCQGAGSASASHKGYVCKSNDHKDEVNKGETCRVMTRRAKLNNIKLGEQSRVQRCACKTHDLYRRYMCRLNGGAMSADWPRPGRACKNKIWRVFCQLNKLWIQMRLIFTST